MSENLVHSVVKALRILDILAFEDVDARGMGLFELARKMELKPNTLHNLLKTMISCGYISQNSDSKYTAGPKCYQLASRSDLSIFNYIADKVKPFVEELCDKTEESAVFTILQNGSRIALVQSSYDSPIKIDYSTIEREDIYERATGRILTAFTSESDRMKIKMKWGYPGEQWNNIDNETDFNKEILKIRDAGIISDLSKDGTIMSYAVPVFTESGEMLGALGCYAPFFRCNEEKNKLITCELTNIASSISRVVRI